MPFFSFATFRGVLLDSDARYQLSPTYGVANFPYIVYPGFTNVDGVHVPQDIAMNYCRYLFAARMPNIGNSDIYNSVIETGPNVYRLENLMYVLIGLSLWTILSIWGFANFLGSKFRSEEHTSELQSH